MWKQKYKDNNFYWGHKAVGILEKYQDSFKVGNALDIGAGEGRNALFLSRLGFNVDVVEAEEEGIKKLENIAKKQKINNIKLFVQDIKKFKFIKKYDLVVAINVLDFLKLSDIKKLVLKIKESINVGGFVVFSTFSLNDPLFKKITEDFKKEEIEKNTFYLQKSKIYRHFFTRSELRNFFSDWNILELNEKQISDEHGDSGWHKHSIIELVAKK